MSEEELETRKIVTGQSGYLGKIIAAINPAKYSENSNELEKLKKENFWKAVASAKENPAEQHKITYDSSSETLEPVYFWVLDKMNEFFGGKVEKIIDNFASSPGGGHFSELMAKGTKMQEEAMKIMQTNGVLIKSLINIIYDLKEFEIRLSHYKSANSKDKDEAEAGLLALKQIWMDNVDIKRGVGSINALTSGNLNFVTLRDAFMIAKSLEEVKRMDLNDRVKRILEPRLQEFLKWRELSERELRKRYEIEKVYLKNQLNSLKLYTRWAKPYLKAATQLEQKDIKNPALVTAFNTIVFELVLLGKKEFDFKEAVLKKELPESFKEMKLKRKFYSCVLVDFYFRGIPQRVGQHYVFGGRAEVTFKAYALNEQEVSMLNKKLEESDINDALKLVEGMTDESIKQLQEDINYFLKEEAAREKIEEAKEKGEDVNPFLALIGLGKKKEKPAEMKKAVEEIKPDNYMEKLIRALAEASARETCYLVYDIYKKAHNMASHNLHEDYEPSPIRFPGKTFFGL